MSNHYGKFYGYTGFFPILENTPATAYLTSLRQVLASLDNGPGSLFSRSGLVHGARLFILDDVVFNGYPTKEEHLEYAYLVLSMTFDGELSDLADRLASTGGEDIHEIFSHCFGFPAEQGATKSILEFLQQGQVTTSMLYVDADGDLKETLKSLVLQKEITNLLIECQFADGETRRQKVLELSTKMERLGELVPGGFH